MPDDKVYDAFLELTGSEEAAAEAWAEFLAEKLRRNETPQV